jgi:glycerol-3-phosphate dehydrogenase
VTIAGGKLTTYRVMAAQAVDQAVEVLRRDGGTTAGTRWPTEDRVIVAGPPAGVTQLAGITRPEVSRRLLELYGARAPEVAAVVAATPGGEEPLCQGGLDVFGQAVYAVEREMALHLDDVLSRRTHALYAGISMQEATVVAERLAGLAGWDDQRLQAEIADFAHMHQGTHGWRTGS